MTETITEIQKLAQRKRDGHKGDFGKVLVVGGSRGMIGAPSLAGQAALRSGAGLVRIATPISIQLSVAQLTPCATTIPLTEDEKGLIDGSALNDILNALEDNDCLVLGPGLGTSNDLQEIIRQIESSGQLEDDIVQEGSGLITNTIAMKLMRDISSLERRVLASKGLEDKIDNLARQNTKLAGLDAIAIAVSGERKGFLSKSSGLLSVIKAIR